MVGVVEVAWFVLAARTASLSLVQRCTRDGLTKASVSKSGPDVDLDGRPAGHQPPIQWSQGVPVASRRASARERLMWGKSVHKNVALVLGAANYNNDLQIFARCEINTDGIPNSTVWESVTREPPQPGNHLEPAWEPTPEPPHHYLRNLIKPSHLNLGNLRTEPLPHWSFIWAETPKLTLLRKKNKPFPLKKKYPGKRPPNSVGGVGG